MNFAHRSLLLVVALAGALHAAAPRPNAEAHTWRSTLYPETWDASALPDFETSAFLQDFSFAGYHAGARPLPRPAGPVFDVTRPPYAADPAGLHDSTDAIQRAIDAAAAVDGGVVHLPAGRYLLSVSDGRREALLIRHPRILLRGDGPDRTFLLNTTTAMRSRVVVRVASSGDGGDFFHAARSVAITRDLPKPTRRIPVAATDHLSPGDFVVIRHDLSDAWIDEHGEPTWKAERGRPLPPTYFRQILSVDAAASEIEIDSPIRYYLKTRDHPVVIRHDNPPLREVGIEHLAIANLQHPDDRWAEEDYRIEGAGAWHAHASYLIAFERVRDAWIRDVRSFQPEANISGAHLLANGILLQHASRVTIADTHFARPQFGGGGGNGYLYRLRHANDCLLLRSSADFSRHGFVFSHAGSNGNVLHACTDARTGRATGHTGSYRTAGAGSDHHMHFSHANLIDLCVADDSWFEARYRHSPRGAAVLHGVTAAHTVFWNTKGDGTLERPVVISEQARYGYIIGTRGPRSSVELRNHRPAATDPVDHVEGLGLGDFLAPQSLYLDQLRRRLGHDLLQ